MKNVSDILTVNHICDITSTTKDDAINELCELFDGNPDVANRDDFLSAIKSREAIMSTGIGMGIAIPHAKTSSIRDIVMAFGRSRKGIDFNALDGSPVHIIILIGASDTQGDDFLKVLAKIGRIFKDESYSKQFLEAGTPEELLNLIIEQFG